MRRHAVMTWLWVLSLISATALCVLALVLSEVNLDEGWYLYAARLVSRGLLPYVDFSFTQGPVLPFVYSAGEPFVRVWGVLGGRWLSLAFGVASCVCAAFLATRIVSKEHRWAAAWFTVTLVLMNAYQVSFFAIVKTYSLAAFLLTTGFLCFTLAAGRRNILVAILSGVFFAAAIATRLSAVAAPLAALSALAWHGLAKRQRDWGLFKIALAAAISTFVASLAAFLPFLLKSPEAVRFGLYEYHAARSAGGFLSITAYKAGFVSRLIQDYFAAFSLAVMMGCYLILSRIKGRTWSDSALPDSASDTARAQTPSDLSSMIACAGWLGVLGVTALHFAAPFPYDDYQTFIFPLAAALLSAEITRRIGGVLQTLRCGPDDRERIWCVGMAMIFLISAGAAFSSPVTHSWFVGQRDRLWWPLREETSLGRLRRASRMIKELCGPDRLVLTQDTYLAVDAGLDVPRGMEMGPFCYFPDWPRDRAERLHVLNREMMMELLLSTEASVAALSGYGLAVRSPEIVELPGEEQRELRAIIEERYRLVHTVRRFGHAETTLEIYRRRSGMGEDSSQ